MSPGVKYSFSRLYGLLSLAWLIAVAAFWLFPVILGAQGATLRLDLPGGNCPGLMRPDVFPVARTAVVPLSPNLDSLTWLGEFRDRWGRAIDSLPGKLGLDGRLHQRAAGELYAATDGRTLCLEVRCHEPEPGLMQREFNFYFPDDRVELHLDLDHEHRYFERIAVTPAGEMRQYAYSVAENHLACDRAFQEEKARLSVKVRTHLDKDVWTLQADIILPDSLIEPGGWAVVGFNAARYRGVHGEETSLWCPDSNRVWAPLYFGDLYLGEPPALIRSVTLGRVAWGENRGELHLAKGSFPGRVGVSTWNWDGLYGRREYVFKERVCRFEYALDPHELMKSGLRFELNGRKWGGFIWGWKRGLLLTHRPTGLGKAPRPAPGEPDYQWKLARYVLDRLPMFERKPDGLTLTSPGISIPLASPDPFTTLARLIMERFKEDDERLIAATLILCQQGVMVSSGTGEKVVEPLGPLGTLRNGAAFCNSYADLLRELVSRIEDSSGRHFRACVVNYKDGPVNTRGWPHHWVAGVALRGGLTLIDSELGAFFINPQSGRLATLEELLAHPDWADSTARGLSEYFLRRQAGDFVVRESGDFWILE